MYTEKRLKRKSLRHPLMLALLGALLLLSPAAYAQMSDDAVAKYVLEARRSGKSDRQIGQELMARGVSASQVERLKQKYEDSQGGGTTVADQSVSGQCRERYRNSSDTLTAGSLDAVDAQVSDPTEGAANPREVFGRNVFRSRTLTFEPNENQNLSRRSFRTETERLQNEMNLAYNLYNQTAQQLQLAKAKVQELTPVYAVVQAATVPLEPSKPSKVLILIGCVFLAGAAAAAWTLFGKNIVGEFRKEIEE